MSSQTEISNSASEQLTTFYIGKELFGLEVMKVQEVTGNLDIVSVPLAPNFVLGLVNLRGQIATAIGLRELFSKSINNKNENEMSVVCKTESNLVSLVVDSIGDVVEVDRVRFEKTPDTVPANLKKFIKGIYKMDGVLLSVLDIEIIYKELSPINESAAVKS